MDASLFHSGLLAEPLGLLKTAARNHFVLRLFFILLYAVAAKAADLFLDRLLKRLAARSRILADDRLVDAMHMPVCLSILLFGFHHALLIRPLPTAPFNHVLPDIVNTLLLLIWWVFIIRGLNRLQEGDFGTYLAKRKVDRDLFLLAKNISRVLIIFAGLAWGLIIWNIDLTPLFASAGIAGIAIALAAKDTMANFIGGIALFADRAYKVGDYIILDRGERGEVVDMGIRSTKIKTRDDVLISIPNSLLANTMIINESAPEPRFRIRIDVGVAYGSDLRKVERTLLQVAAENRALAPHPEPRVRIRAFADSAVNFQLLVWVNDPSEKGLQTHNLLHAVYEAFAREGITIPFPQREVHLVTEALRIEQLQPEGDLPEIRKGGKI